MASEKRRQRQQRVRHEPGDFVPSHTTEKQQIISQKEELATISREKTPECKTESEIRNSAPQSFSKKAAAPPKVEDKGQRNQNDRRNAKGVERGRGRGRPAGGYKRRTFDNKPSNTNVAVAEEREYEPVMIMESRSDGPGGSGSAKLVSPFLPTVAEPQKYRRRPIENNWQPYEAIPLDDEPAEGEDHLVGEDFQKVLDSNAFKSPGGFLLLKEERSWGNVEDTPTSSFGLGALKISDLVAALQTIPLHERLQIPESDLPASYVIRLKRDAERARKAYNPNREYKDETEINQQILDKLKISEYEPMCLSSEGLDLSAPGASQQRSTSVADATQKFASAFKPEPDDVDLESFARGESSQSRGATPTDFCQSSGADISLAKRDTTKVPADSSDFSLPSGLVKNQGGAAVPSGPVNPSGAVGPSVLVNPSGAVDPSVPVQNPGGVVAPSGPSVSVISSSKDNKPIKAEFNFGLSKVGVEPAANIQTTEKAATSRKRNRKKGTGATEAENKGTESTELEQEGTETKEAIKTDTQTEPGPEEPKIDLDEPVKPKPEAPPVLVSKSEVENLEDWLDSVLDD